jgi:hypothetical protein
VAETTVPGETAETPTPFTETCANCRFWREVRTQWDTDQAIAGICRRNAPVVGTHGLWPETDPRMWCGEWQPSVEAQPAWIAAARDRINTALTASHAYGTLRVDDRA